ncbi:MAG: hypothetical protein R2939_05175 [Kofleriaceae bacterium]
MSLRGALATMPALDVLEWAARRRLAATMTFTRGHEVHSVVVAAGTILSTSSSSPEEQLGAILVRSGRLDERTLQDALETRAAIGVPLGRVLLMSGLLAEAELVAALATKAREAVTAIAAWSSGDFEVIPRAVASSPGVAAAVEIELCVELARARSPRLAAALALLGGDQTCFYVPPSARKTPPTDEFSLDVTRLWNLVAAGFPAGRLASVFGGERYRVFDVLATWVERGALVVDRRRRARTDSTLELAAGARARLAAGEPAAALAMAAQAIEQDPRDPEIRRVFAAAERARVASVARGLLTRAATPHRVAKAALPSSLSPLERELAERVDGHWDLLSLMRAAPAREAEVLLAFARLADLGVVELR